MEGLVFIFAYFSPETVLPVTSVLAAVVGFIMMFGRMFLSLITGKAWRRLKARSQPKASLARPHFKMGSPGSVDSDAASPAHEHAVPAEANES